MTKKEALELSVKKWQMIVDNNGIYSLDIQRKFAEFTNSCPLCHLYFKHGDCTRCPINLSGKRYACENGEHPFNDWAGTHSKANAQKVLNLIKSKLFPK
jgi:hypothetical protein